MENKRSWVSLPGLSRIDESVCQYHSYWDSRRDDSDVEPTIEEKKGKTSDEFHIDIRTAVVLELDRRKLPFTEDTTVVSHRDDSMNSGPMAPRDISAERYFRIGDVRIDVDHFHEGNDWTLKDCEPIYKRPSELQNRYLVRYPNIDYQGSERVCRVCPRVATISLEFDSEGNDFIHISADKNGYCMPVSSLDGQELGGPPCLYREYKRSIKK